MITSTIILKRLTNQKLVNQFIESVLIQKQSTQVDFDHDNIDESLFLSWLKETKLIEINLSALLSYENRFNELIH